MVADLNLNILKKASKYQREMLEKEKENPYPMGQMKSGKGRKKIKNKIKKFFVV